MQMHSMKIELFWEKYIFLEFAEFAFALLGHFVLLANKLHIWIM